MTHQEAIEVLGKLLLYQHFYPGTPEYMAVEKAIQSLNRELTLGITE